MLSLNEVKDQRPECTSEDGDHTWVEYHGEGTRECIDCHYTEEIVYPMEY